MNQFSGATVSYWNKTVNIPHHPPLSGHPQVDVCVIGAGISGLTSAYLLAKAGKSVIVVDQGVVAGGDSGRTSAHLSNVMDDGLARMVKMLGRTDAALAAESHGKAIDEIERIVRDENIDCDFRRINGYLFSENESEAGKLQDEYLAAQMMGYEVVREKKSPLQAGTQAPALCFANQARFHATQYLRGLAQAVTRLGGKIYEHTRVSEIKQGNTAIVKTESGASVHAAFVIEAANSLVSGKITTITKLYPYRSFVIGVEIPKQSAPDALFWDLQDPYHYVRIQPDGENDLLIVGGEDHKTGQADDANIRYDRLEAWARNYWPQMGAVKYRWSGQVLETLDGLAMIGVNPGNEENSFLISGDSGQGLTHGTLGAMILSDRILGRPNAFAKIYEPTRFHARSMGDWLQENANVGLQYLDWVSPGEVASVDKIPNGEGAVVRQGLKKVAVYRDPSGKLSACSATCPHLGAVVSWNSAEKTWDCPAHGSRFDCHGKVVANPATADLVKVAVPKTGSRAPSRGTGKNAEL